MAATVIKISILPISRNLKARFGQGFDGKLSYGVETCVSGETAAVARECTA